VVHDDEHRLHAQLVIFGPRDLQVTAGGGIMLRVAPDESISDEDARLAAAAALDVTLYTRPGCHLCEEAKSAMAPLLAEFGARLREVNIDEDAVLRARYDYDVPVIFLGARKVAKHRVDVGQLRRRLEEARLEARS
jgi:glutaredoxin